ncbi:MAG: alpha-glucan family phosphorylase [Chloroflexota bacterium]
MISGAPREALTVAYFSMECGLDPAMPTYSGGLGILAGDTLRAAADLGLPAVGITLLHRKGYGRQHLDAQGNQSESDVTWSPRDFLEPLPLRVAVTIAGRQVQVQAWRYLVHGEFGFTVPIYFLDTALPENTPWEQSLTDHLYGGDRHYRLAQEIVLGFGGVALLRSLGYTKVHAYHMNEGHSTLTVLALLEEQVWGRGLAAATSEDKEAVRQRCVFTTHTPVLAGQDDFPLDLAREVLGEELTDLLSQAQCCIDGRLNLSALGVNFSRYVNGVSLRHEEISRQLFSNHFIDAISNGVHALTWTGLSFRQLYDRYIPEWRRDNLYLRYAVGIPLDEIWQAHLTAKEQLLAEVAKRSGVRLDPTVLTIGFARRAAAYKRMDFLFRDLDRLKRITQQVGPIQVLCGGKAHPHDEGGKALIRRIFEAAGTVADTIPVVYLEEYDIALAKYLVSGVDLWLNTPQKPQEASGTSGMKAALNGIPSLSILDGWWIEGHVEGVTGWSIGDSWQTEASPESEIKSLYDKLEYLIVPMFYTRHNVFTGIMRSAIAINGSYFNAQRMVAQYLQNAYLRAANP